MLWNLGISQKFCNGLIFYNCIEAAAHIVKISGGWRRRKALWALMVMRFWGHRANRQRDVTVSFGHLHCVNLILTQAHQADFTLHRLSRMESISIYRIFPRFRDAGRSRCHAVLPHGSLLVVKEYLARSRTILLQPDLAEGVARAQFAAEHFWVLMWWNRLAVGAWPWRAYLRQLMRNSCLVNELLFGVRAKRNNSVIEALLLDSLIHRVVIDCGFGTVWRGIQPPCASFLTVFHILYVLIYIWSWELVVTIIKL